MENISTLAIIITVLLTLITIIMTTVAVQLNRVTTAMTKIDNRLIVVETEHKNRGTNCGALDSDLHRDIKDLVQTLRLYDELKKKQNG